MARVEQAVSTNFRRNLSCHLSLGMRAIGLDAFEATVCDILDITGAKHLVSVGSGQGIAEAALRLPSNIQIHGVDPAPTSFRLLRPVPSSVPTCMPSYAKVKDLMDDEPMRIAMRKDGVVLLLIWPPQMDGDGFDMEAVRLLQPCAVVTVCDLLGYSGSEVFLQWLTTLNDCNGGTWAELPHSSIVSLHESQASVPIPNMGTDGFAAYIVTHDRRRPAYLRQLPREYANLAKKGKSIKEIVVILEPGDVDVGIMWDGQTKVVRGVAEQGAIARCGGKDLVGWRVTHVNGVWASRPQDVDALAHAGQPLNLRLIRENCLVMNFACIAAVRETDISPIPPPKYDRGDGFLFTWD